VHLQAASQRRKLRSELEKNAHVGVFRSHPDAAKMDEVQSDAIELFQGRAAGASGRPEDGSAAKGAGSGKGGDGGKNAEAGKVSNDPRLMASSSSLVKKPREKTRRVRNRGDGQGASATLKKKVKNVHSGLVALARHAHVQRAFADICALY